MKRALKVMFYVVDSVFGNLIPLTVLVIVIMLFYQSQWTV